MIMQADAVSNYTSSLMKEVFYSNTELLTFFKNGLSGIETAPSLWLMDSSPPTPFLSLFSLLGFYPANSLHGLLLYSEIPLKGLSH